MKLYEACKIITEYQYWRRGAEIPQPEPKLISIAIDVLLENCKNLIEKK